MRHRQERRASCDEQVFETPSWQELLGRAGVGSPLLIVADNAAIESEALGWDAALTPSGWSYRVRLATAEAVSGDEAEAVASEATSLAARSMLAVGDEKLLAMAAKAAALAGVSVVSVRFSSMRGQGVCR